MYTEAAMWDLFRYNITFYKITTPASKRAEPQTYTRLKNKIWTVYEMIKSSGFSLTWRTQSTQLQSLVAPHHSATRTVPWAHPSPTAEGASGPPGLAWGAAALGTVPEPASLYTIRPMLSLKRALLRPQGECAQQWPKTTGTKEDTPAGIQRTPRASSRLIWAAAEQQIEKESHAPHPSSVRAVQDEHWCCNSCICRTVLTNEYHPVRVVNKVRGQDFHTCTVTLMTLQQW